MVGTVATVGNVPKASIRVHFSGTGVIVKEC